MTEEEAKRRTRIDFGGHEQVKEDCREARGTAFVELTLHLKHVSALKQLQRQISLVLGHLILFYRKLTTATSVFAYNEINDP